MTAICCFLDSHLFTIIIPCDVVRGPFECIVVPFIFWVCHRVGDWPATELVASTDKIYVVWSVFAMRVFCNWRYDLNIYLTPATLGPVFPFTSLPVGEEGKVGAIFARPPHSGSKFTVLESLVGSNWSWTVLPGLCTSYECNCVFQAREHLLICYCSLNSRAYIANKFAVTSKFAWIFQQPRKFAWKFY